MQADDEPEPACSPPMAVTEEAAAVLGNWRLWIVCTAFGLLHTLDAATLDFH